LAKENAEHFKENKSFQNWHTNLNEAYTSQDLFCFYDIIHDNLISASMIDKLIYMEKINLDIFC